MAEEKVIERLLDFGFTREEAEAYLFLLQAGPSPARTVARKLRINRMKAYRTLKALEEKGLIEVTAERPVKFVAAPLKEALERHIKEMRAKASGLEKSKKEIMNHYENLYRVEVSVEAPKFRILQGRHQVYDLLLQMCERAKADIRLVTTRNDLYRLSFAGIDDKLKDLDRDGVRTRVLTQIDQLGLKAVENYLGFADVRHFNLPTNMRLAVIDEGEALTSVAMDDSMSMTTQDDTGLWTNAFNYVKAMKAFFDALWRAAPDAREVVDAVKAGRVPQEIRIIGTQEEYIETYEDMVESSREEVIIMAKRIQDLLLTIQGLQAASDRGVKIRLLTQIDLDSLPDINRILKLAQVMHDAAATNLQLLIADRRNVLLHILRSEGMGQAIWSNFKAYVDVMVQVFEDHWRDGVPAQESLSKLSTQQTLIEALKLAKKALEEAGWVVEVPGELVGGSGVEHSFSLAAKRLDRPNRPLVLDLLIEEKALRQILALFVKVLDVKPVTPLLAANRPFDNGEARLADLYGIRLVYAVEAQQLAKKIVEEANKIFYY